MGNASGGFFSFSFFILPFLHFFVLPSPFFPSLVMVNECTGQRKAGFSYFLTCEFGVPVVISSRFDTEEDQKKTVRNFFFRYALFHLGGIIIV